MQRAKKVCSRRLPSIFHSSSIGVFCTYKHCSHHKALKSRPPSSRCQQRNTTAALLCRMGPGAFSGPTSRPSYLQFPSLTLLPRILHPPPRPRQRRQNHPPRAHKIHLHNPTRKPTYRPHRWSERCDRRAPQPAQPLPEDLGRRRPA